MVAQRLSIWGALRQISSMNGKNMALRRGDWWVASSSPHPAAALPEKTPTTANRKGMKRRTSPESPLSTLAPSQPFLSSHPDKVVGMEKDSSESIVADRIRKK